jgi:hypothetical protein
MSEYQYYEFQALDRPLTQAEMVELRKLSSRVALTSTSAIFTYNYGDFRVAPKISWKNILMLCSTSLIGVRDS